MQRVRRGQKAYSAGLMGEESVCRDYVSRGYAPIASRWRGSCGEIDLIMQRGDEYVFVEVKASSSHARAAERIDRRQMDRICNAALEFCTGLAQGLLTLMRFDAALVDATGRVQVIENAFGSA
ncbi:YraN family protein [Paracoccus shanxieyensis]|uniref:Uncharacterized protein n=1 Tax=Paracoccus shanxieyensis TaxID=2675752 RepID=A0A6L6IXK4_9RHOB|nr:YraN family protein [Paracoccus shanxieyensis]MTH63780.1 hypothetical protein [Paracoccus shanxieyensis]MTH86709.1 hypothetical protein [Paracoccus shanxieyensis]